MDFVRDAAQEICDTMEKTTNVIEEPSGDHPYGIRAVGQVPIVPPAAAIANAIYRAVGVRLRELPMTPERLWRAIRDAGSPAAAIHGAPPGEAEEEAAVKLSAQDLHPSEGLDRAVPSSHDDRSS